VLFFRVVRAVRGYEVFSKKNREFRQIPLIIKKETLA
jgi:hypothetical protein